MLDPITMMDELDTYGFNCEAGSLEWAPLWIDLRRAVIALRQQNHKLRAQLEQQRRAPNAIELGEALRPREDVID